MNGAEKVGPGGSRPRLRLAAVLLALVALALGCTREKLPKEESYAAQLYIKRCGHCHAPINPRRLTAATWEAQVAAMEARMREAGDPPLRGKQLETILGYLRENADGR